MLDENSLAITGLVKTTFENRLRYGAAELFGSLYKLETEQSENFAKGNQEEIQPGKFEKKVLDACDACFTKILRDTVEEFDDIYSKTGHHDPRFFWEAVKKSLFDLCKNEEAIEAVFQPYLRPLHFGHFEATKCVHVDWKSLITNWVLEFRSKASYTSLSTPNERRENLIPDVVVVLGREDPDTISEEKKSLFEKRYMAIQETVKRASEKLATVDEMDSHLNLDSQRRGAVVERWLKKAPIVIVDLTSQAPVCYSVLGIRKFMRGNVVAICEKESWDQNALELLQWDVLKYQSLLDLKQRLGFFLYEIFEMHEFSGNPEIIL